MTQKELTCRGLEVWRHGVRRHVGRTEYYRTTPANSSPNFCWLNGKAHKANIMEHPTCISRRRHMPHLRLESRNHRQEPFVQTRRRSLSARAQESLNRIDHSTTHGVCVPWLAVPATDLRRATSYSPSRALIRPEIPPLRAICSKTASPFGSPKLTIASPAAVARL